MHFQKSILNDAFPESILNDAFPESFVFFYNRFLISIVIFHAHKFSNGKTLFTLTMLRRFIWRDSFTHKVSLTLMQTMHVL